MTWFSRAATNFLMSIFGRVAVQPHRLARAQRIFKATLEENGLDPSCLPEPAYEGLMAEIIERARNRDLNEVLRWKHLIGEILAVSEMVCSALKGVAIEDKRIRDILILHKTI